MVKFANIREIKILANNSEFTVFRLKITLVTTYVISYPGLILHLKISQHNVIVGPGGPRSSDITGYPGTQEEFRKVRC